MRTDLVHIGLDGNTRLPGHASIRRAGDAADVNVGHEHRSVPGGGHRTDSERRSDAFAVDDRRAGVPRIAPGDLVETIEPVERSVDAHAQHPGIVAANVNDVANRNAAREIHVRGGDSAPGAAGGTPAQRASVDNRECATEPVGCKYADRLPTKLLVDSPVDDEQAVLPGGHQHRWWCQSSQVRPAATLRVD